HSKEFFNYINVIFRCGVEYLGYCLIAVLLGCVGARVVCVELFSVVQGGLFCVELSLLPLRGANSPS
ncbi:MAG TPA: hypothetical protein VMW25_06645, partial [Clostridia bacterium]|nr:hypothetical protein [Clostridia bacterium]